MEKSDFEVGDVIKVSAKVKEGDKVRIQSFAGTVIAFKGAGSNKTFTVRKEGSGGIGVERIWPLNSPHLEEIKVIKKGDVRRAKLYYLRDKKQKLS